MTGVYLLAFIRLNTFVSRKDYTIFFLFCQDLIVILNSSLIMTPTIKKRVSPLDKESVPWFYKGNRLYGQKQKQSNN